VTLIILRILFFCLIPIGIVALITGIKLVRKSFYGNILFEIPYSQKIGQFSVLKAGTFSIWQKGQLFKRAPFDRFRPHIYNELTNEELQTSFSLFGLRSNGFSTGRTEIFTFYAPIGNYKIELKEGTSVPKIQVLISKILPFDPFDLTKYFIQIRETQPKIFVFLAIPIIFFGVFGIIGGFVLGLLADKILN